MSSTKTTTTDQAPSKGRSKPRRASKLVVRTWAWIGAAIGFFAPAAAFGVQPKPVQSASPARQERPVIIVERVIRRVIVHEEIVPATPATVYVSQPSSGGSSSSTSTPVAAPVQQPVATTSGS